MKRGLGLAVALLLAGCGSGVPSTPTGPTPAASVTLGASPTVEPAPESVVVDGTLLDRLPTAIDGVPSQPDPDTAAEVARDPTLAGQVQAIAIAIYVAPETSASAGDYAVATVVRLRTGVFSEGFYRVWRDSFDDGVCEQAGGVRTRAETTIAGRVIHIGTCDGGVRTYHAHLPSGDLLVSIQAVGERRLGERIVADLEE